MLRPTYVPTIIVIIFYLTVSLWVFESRRPGIVVDVQNSPSMVQMVRVIQEQKDRIEYLSSHRKVVYRCLDDESKIKYPRKASDDLTEIKMSTNDECGNSPTDAVVIVHTSADHFKRRQKFRMAYSNYNNTKPYRLKLPWFDMDTVAGPAPDLNEVVCYDLLEVALAVVPSPWSVSEALATTGGDIVSTAGLQLVVFLIGSVIDADLHIKLEMENMQYGDTVVGSFLDTYQNLTLKAVMGFRWLANTCSDVKLLIKLDDDVFFDVRRFFTNYWQKINNKQKKRTIHCLVWNNARVGRTGKWKVEKGLFANASYPFPYCAGFLALVTPDLIKPMYTVGKSIDFFWIDDVFLYGMTAAAIQGVGFIQLGRNPKFLTQNYKEYQQCRESKGEKCPLWATLTNGEDEFDKEYAAMTSPLPTVNQTVTKSQHSKVNKPIVLSGKNNSSKAIVKKKNLPAINGTAAKSKAV